MCRLPGAVAETGAAKVDKAADQICGETSWCAECIDAGHVPTQGRAQGTGDAAEDADRRPRMRDGSRPAAGSSTECLERLLDEVSELLIDQGKSRHGGEAPNLLTGETINR